MDKVKVEGEEKGRVETGGPSPEIKSSVLSFLTWHWVQPLIMLGNRKPLEAEDLYDLIPKECTLHCEQSWKKAFGDERKKRAVERVSVWRVLYRSMGKEFMMGAICKPIWLLAVVLQVYVLRGLVRIAQTSHTEHLHWWWATLLVVAMMVTSTTQSVTQHLCFTLGQKTGMKVRATVGMAVFDKLLEMRIVSLVSTNSGNMLNLVTNDTQKLLDAATFWHYVWFAVVEVSVIGGLVIYEAGIAGIPGFVLIFLTQPLQVKLAQVVGRLRRTAIKFTDARVQSVNEVLTGVRVVKYNGWSAAFLKRIAELRNTEIRWIRKAAFLRASTSTLKDGVAPLASLATFGTYVAIHGGAALTPSLSFTILALFSILVRVFSIAPLGEALQASKFKKITNTTMLAIQYVPGGNTLDLIFSGNDTGVQFASEALVAVQRLQRLLDLPNGNGFSDPTETAEVFASIPEASVAVSNGTFSWTLRDGDFHRQKITGNLKQKVGGKENTVKTDTDIPAGKDFQSSGKSPAALEGINFKVNRGELVAIVGSVGCGKSSLLLAILGEMEVMGNLGGSCQCLRGVFKKDRLVAYAPQQPWILNDTIRANILFGSKYEKLRYNQTVSACALDHDILEFAAGHDTEIGERGVNLSGGQKARISLARACYSDSPLLLLDDPLAAVDVPTAKHLMDQVLVGILKGRTVVLVTHNKTSLSLCDRVYMLEHGKLKEVPKKDLIEGQVAEVIFDGLGQNSGDIIDEGGTWDIEGDIEDIEGGGELGIEGDSREEGHVWEDEQKKSECESNNLESVVKSSENGYLEGLADEQVPELKADARGEIRNPVPKQPVTKNVGGVVSLLRTLQLDKAAEIATENDVNSTAREEREGAKCGTDASRAKAGGTLIVKEDRVEGVVTWSTYIQYARDGGGLAFFTFVMVVFLLGQAVRVMVDYWLSVWVDRKYHLSTRMYVISYACFAGGAIILSLVRALMFTVAALWSAKKMHNRMAERVLRSPQSFFDQNPVGRVVNRFSKDQALVDELLPNTAQTMLENLVGCLGSIGIIAVLIPWFLLCMPPFLLVFLYLQRRYVVVSREMKRLDGLSRSPMYAHFAQTLQGISSVRAYGAEERMHDQFIGMIDANHRAYILFVHASRWLGIRLDFAAGICVTTAALLVVLLRHTLAPGLAGVVLVQSLQLTGFFQYGVRLAADTENYFTSVERIQAYSDLPTEAEPHTAPGIITEDWPQKGEIEFVHYTMAYREDLRPVLNDLSFKVKAKEKVGILGRTGAGKSSLAAALFRLVENRACSGSILIDGIDITRVGLDDLRQRLSIIPQDPVLFRGTVRLNLDPFERHTDAEINEALARVHLSKKIESLDEGLDSSVSENGDNFSVGQRQLLCLARSLLRRSRIIVMDEATAAVDGETDQLIQTAMRNVFYDCTVLTIAHRIDTIIDSNRVLVLARGGRIAEFDSPVNLLRRAENLTASRSHENGDGTGRAGFADIVAQSGAVIAKQLRQAAEAAEFKRQGNS